MLITLALAIMNYFFTKRSLNDINNGVTISDIASARLTSALRSWQWALVCYASRWVEKYFDNGKKCNYLPLHRKY